MNRYRKTGLENIRPTNTGWTEGYETIQFSTWSSRNWLYELHYNDRLLSGPHFELFLGLKAQCEIQ